jgi:hypothetical protein
LNNTRFYVYLWSDPANNIPRYVGKGAGKRAWDHIQDKSSARISYLLKKRHASGYVCIPQIIWLDSEAEAYEFEKLLIAEIGRLDLGTGTLFNCTDGGDGARGLNSDARRRQGLSSSRVQKGRPFTEEHRANCNASAARRSAALHGVTVQHWTSLSKCERRKMTSTRYNRFKAQEKRLRNHVSFIRSLQGSSK